MKNRADLVRRLIRKGESDLVNAEMCVSKRQSLDAACFHAQQGAEKYIKAYLTAKEVDYPFIHNLERKGSNTAMRVLQSTISWYILYVTC